jgi:hypothetical protein
VHDQLQFFGSCSSQWKRVGYAQLPQAVAYVVLTSRDQASYQKNFGALEKVLKTLVYVEPKSETASGKDYAFFAFGIDDGSSSTFVLFCDSERKLPVGRFVSDNVFRFERRQKAIPNQNGRECPVSVSQRWLVSGAASDRK